ncbi:MAG: discoidin domain-containing protein [Clostridia bacterium]|nr:discoidin domain-containing protein [Clostridia bacterium]
MKKIISLLLSFCMMLGCVSAFAFDSEALLKVSENITNDFSNDGASPDGYVSRAAMAEYAVKLLDKNDVGSSVSAFDDVNEDALYVNRAAELGIVNGDGISFYPERYVTFAESCKMLVAALDYNLYADVKGGYYPGFVEAAKALGITDGIELEPDAYITASQAVKMLANALLAKPSFDAPEGRVNVPEYTFDYPEVTAETFKKDISAAVEKGHPYIFADKEDFEKVKANAFGQNKYLTKIYADVKAQADTYVDRQVTTLGQVLSGRDYNGRAGECLSAISTCALVYMVEGDERYAQRAYDEAAAWAELESWGTYQYIDNNFPVFSLAICYDWLYDWMTEEQRDKIFTSLKEKHFDTMYDMATRTEENKPTSGFIMFYYNSNNHAVLDNTATFVAAMALADREIDYATKIMEWTFKNMEASVKRYFPDSAWYEGTGYWGYTGPFMARWLISMQTALGTTYGLAETEWLKGIGYFPIYDGTVDNRFVINDSSVAPRSDEYVYLLSILSGNKDFENYAVHYTSTSNPFTCLGFNVNGDYDAPINVDTFSLDKHFRNTDEVTMRSTWDGDTPVFAGMFVQDANLTHGTMNSGTLTLQALGNLWVSNPGRDDYGLAGYWKSGQDGQRWTYYFGRAEANSCLVINPDEGGGQIVNSHDVVNIFKSSPRGAYAISDLTKTYAPYAKSYRRGIALTEDRSVFVVQDELELLEESEVYSFLNIYDSEITIAPDSKSVVLKKGNKYVKIDILCDAPYELSVMRCEPLPTSPNPDGQRVINNISKLAFHFPSTKGYNMRLEMCPYLLEEELTPASDSITPFEQWTVAEGEYVTDGATSIIADDAPIADFNPATRCYELDTMPEKLECIADTAKYDVSYKDSADGSAKYVILKNKQTGKIVTYIIEEKEPVPVYVAPDITGLEEVKVLSTVATADDGNAAENTIDGDMVSRWSAAGKQSITYTLENVTDVKGLGIAFYSGDKRSTYFDILISEDGESWENVQICQSSGLTLEFEYFLFDTAKKAKYIRLDCRGNSSTSSAKWNSITEFKVLK